MGADSPLLYLKHVKTKQHRDKDTKTVINVVRMLKGQRKCCTKRRDTEHIEKTQIQHPGMKTTMSAMQNTLRGLRADETLHNKRLTEKHSKSIYPKWITRGEREQSQTAQPQRL